MKPDKLVAMSAPGSVDITAAAGGEDKKRTRKRPGLLQVGGRSTPVYTQREWSLAELGQASMGVPEIAFQAACYSWAGAHSYHARLHDALHAEALKLRRRMNWSMRVTCADGAERGYLPEMAELVLQEEARPSLFTACQNLHATFLQVTPDLWAGRLEDRYTHIKHAYSLWLSDAWRIMAPRLADDWESSL